MDQLDENKDQIIELSRSKRRKEESKQNKHKKAGKPSEKQKNEPDEEGLSQVQKEYNNADESNSVSAAQTFGSGEKTEPEVYTKPVVPTEPVVYTEPEVYAEPVVSTENAGKYDQDNSKLNTAGSDTITKLQDVSQISDDTEGNKKSPSFFRPIQAQTHQPQENKHDKASPAGVKKGKKKAAPYTLAVLILLIIVTMLAFFLFGIDKIEGNSMNDSLRDGDLVLYIKLNTSIKTGDIVLIKNPEVPSGVIIKRVIAVEGDVISVQPNGTVLLNKEFLEEPYARYEIINTDEPLQYYPFTIPEGTVFVMGDNRGNSKDSRFLSVGPIPVSDVLGEAVTSFRSY